MINKSNLLNGISWVFGILVLAVGIVNTFWGNDPFFGIMIVVLSFIYFPPVNLFLKKKTGFSIPIIVKIVLGLFIIWASLGVGELLSKIKLMLSDL